MWMLMWLAAPPFSVSRTALPALQAFFSHWNHPLTRFSDYTIDFIFGLPPTAGFTGIMTVVDRATKHVVLTPVHDSITAPQGS